MSGFSFAETYDSCNVSKRTRADWFHTDDEVLARLLARRPELINLRDGLGRTALHLAAKRGHDRAVERLLAANPSSIDDVDRKRWTPLHYAANRGKRVVVAQLLAAKPSLVYVCGNCVGTPLHLAARRGHGEIVTQLLAVSPELIHATDPFGRNALHDAVVSGREAMVAQLLSLCPELARAVAPICDRWCWTMLHFALGVPCRDKIAHMLLDLDPAAVFAMEGVNGRTALRMALRASLPLIERIFRLNPEALYAKDDSGNSLFRQACFLRHKEEDVIDFFQRKLSFDEIMAEDRDRAQRAMRLECAALLGFLIRDVVEVIHEYIGLSHQSPTTELEPRTSRRRRRRWRRTRRTVSYAN